jgi:hypothetical protein
MRTERRLGRRRSEPPTKAKGASAGEKPARTHPLARGKGAPEKPFRELTQKLAHLSRDHLRLTNEGQVAATRQPP